MAQSQATMAEVAEAVGVTRQQVATWYRRRETNNFPAPVGESQPASGPSVYRYLLWDLQEVVKWHNSYIPSRGGRPKKLPSPQD